MDAVSWLKERGYEFQPLDVLTDKVAYDRMKEISGQRLTPTLETEDGLVLADFDVGQLEKFLKTNHILPG